MRSRILEFPVHERLAYLRKHVTTRFQMANPCAEGSTIPGCQLSISLLRELGAQQWFLENIQRGIQLPVRSKGVTVQKNHPSFYANQETAEAEWDRLDHMGKIRWWEKDAKPRNLNVNPCAILLKDEQGPDGEWRVKKRIILDLLRGRVKERLEDVAVSYATLEEAVSKMHRGSWLFVIDLVDAFFNWPLNEAGTLECGFYSPKRKKFGAYAYLPFGLSVAPGFNDAHTKEVLRLLKHHTGVDLTGFVDDLLGNASSEDDAWLQLEAAVLFFTAIGVPVSIKQKGLVPPAQRTEWIGWVFDTVLLLVTVPGRKVEKCRESIREVLSLNTAGVLRATRIAACAGLANHICEVYVPGRRRLHFVWTDMRAAGVYAAWQKGARGPMANPLVTLSPEAIRDLNWLMDRLLQTPSRRLCCPGEGFPLSDWGPKSPALQAWQQLSDVGAILVVETDASKLHGWSYHITNWGVVVSGIWPEDFASRDLTAEFINYKETWTVVECCRREGARFAGWRALFRVDNSCAVHYVCFRYGRSPAYERLIVPLEDAEVAHGFWAQAIHIRGKDNRVADEGSRDAAFARNWANDDLREAMLATSCWGQLCSHTKRTPVHDLFSDASGELSQTPQGWNHPGRSAFEEQLTPAKLYWAFPPKALVRAFLSWRRDQKKVGPVPEIWALVPLDERAPWFRPEMIGEATRLMQWPAGAAIFRVRDSDTGRWRKRSSSSAYVVLRFPPSSG